MKSRKLQRIQEIKPIKSLCPDSEINRVSEPKRIGITGSPGTGKRTLGKHLSKILKEEFVSINDFAVREGYGKKSDDDFVVDVRRLGGKIKTGNRIISGHLLPYVIPDRDLDLVIVLRCSPTVLRKRYDARGYSEDAKFAKTWKQN